MRLTSNSGRSQLQGKRGPETLRQVAGLHLIPQTSWLLAPDAEQLYGIHFLL